MTVTDVRKDTDRLTLTITAELPVPAERAWQLWADPRQLERWWGPPTWPATVVEHELAPGGRVTYYMTGPEGDRAGGLWDVLEVEPPRRLVVRDRFTDDDGVPNPDMPSTVMHLTITDRDSGVAMTIESQFASVEAMEQLVAMGMVEGIQAAMSQIDAILVG